MRVADIDRPDHLVIGRHQPHHPLDQVVHEAERPRLAAIAVQRDRLVVQRLHDEVRHDPAVIRMHPRPIRVEDPHHLDAQIVLPAIVEEQRLRRPLALVVARPRPQRIDVAAVLLRLRMHVRVAINLARAGLQDLRLHPLGQAQHVDRPHDGGLRRLHRVELVMDRRGRAGEVVDLVHLDIERKRHVVPQRLELRPAQQVRDVVLAPREVIVDAKHVVPLLDQPLAEMRPQEPGPAGHQDTLARQTHGKLSLLHACIR